MLDLESSMYDKHHAQESTNISFRGFRADAGARVFYVKMQDRRLIWHQACCQKETRFLLVFTASR